MIVRRSRKKKRESIAQEEVNPGDKRGRRGWWG
jgi:hypothetical protein